MSDDQPDTTQERCSCGGTIIFDDERGVAYCPDCKSYEAYTTPELCEKAKTGQPQTTDPWRGIKRGDRFWIVGWNVREDAQLWEEVTDLWFDPVRGQHSIKRGYVVAIRLMGNGRKRMLAASTLAGKGYRRVELIDVSSWIDRESAHA